MNSVFLVELGYLNTISRFTCTYVAFYMLCLSTHIRNGIQWITNYRFIFSCSVLSDCQYDLVLCVLKSWRSRKMRVFLQGNWIVIADNELGVHVEYVISSFTSLFLIFQQNLRMTALKCLHWTQYNFKVLIVLFKSMGKLGWVSSFERPIKVKKCNYWQNCYWFVLSS